MGLGRGSGVANIQFSEASARWEPLPARSRQVARQGAQGLATIGERAGTGLVVVFIAFTCIPKKTHAKVTAEVGIPARHDRSGVTFPPNLFGKSVRAVPQAANRPPTVTN